MDSTTTTRGAAAGRPLALHWVEVTDTLGRAHLEMRWAAPAPAPAPTGMHHQHAA